ncbi:MAG: type II methionyl aminopeptidase [Desulfurococcales archaeon ex4484_58]|nr:MAG: type II methionyl aminopeptidase [Desulfurococcales archaeon ex4484_58]
MVLSDEEIKKLREAGRIAKTVREEAVRKTKPGTKLLELAEYIEKRIEELGGKPAFPVNISINEEAAHYTPVIGDGKVIPENSVVKIDIGVHVDGYIADTATTVYFNPVHEGLVEASKKALEKVIDNLKPGIKANDIGKIVEETITSLGYKPIRNLSGHSIDRYMIHSGKSIPNYNEIFSRWRLVDGVYAIEPFATNGVGYVKEKNIITIYSIKKISRIRLTSKEKSFLQNIWNERKKLPFTERWYKKLFDNVESLRNTLTLMMKRGIIHGYPLLIEKSGGLVSQFEHTIIVSGREIIITTE